MNTQSQRITNILDGKFLANWITHGKLGSTREQLYSYFPENTSFNYKNRVLRFLRKQKVIHKMQGRYFLTNHESANPKNA
jgi:hypothetical protein